MPFCLRHSAAGMPLIDMISLASFQFPIARSFVSAPKIRLIFVTRIKFILTLIVHAKESPAFALVAINDRLVFAAIADLCRARFMCGKDVRVWHVDKLSLRWAKSGRMTRGCKRRRRER